MPLRLVRGRFRVQGSEPDGDSVKFLPDDRAALAVAAPGVHLGAGGGAQLRLDAIDALETHYSPPAGQRTHQPSGLAHAAADSLLAQLGFTHVERAGETITASEPAETPGHILTRFADTHGRPVAVVFAGDPTEPDGTLVHLDPDRLTTSANHRLLADGLAYPTYYSRLYPDLREALTTAVAQARAARTGIWALDATTSGVTIDLPTTLAESAVILPKLFRRLVDYLALGAEDLALDGFLAFLSVREDRLFILSTRHATGLDTIVEVTGQTVRLTRPPEDLVFIEQ